MEVNECVLYIIYSIWELVRLNYIFNLSDFLIDSSLRFQIQLVLVMFSSFDRTSPNNHQALCLALPCRVSFHRLEYLI